MARTNCAVRKRFLAENKDRGRFSDEAAPSTREQTREYRLRLFRFWFFTDAIPFRSDQSDKRACVLLCSCHKDTLDKIHPVCHAHESVRLFRTPAYAKFEDLSTRVADRGRMTELLRRSRYAALREQCFGEASVKLYC